MEGKDDRDLRKRRKERIEGNYKYKKRIEKKEERRGLKKRM